MKRKMLSRFSMKLFFTVFVIVELFVVIAVSWGLIELLHLFFDFSHDIPDIVWLLVFGAALGSAITTFLGKFFFDPIMEIRQAMRQVAEGDFTVRLNEGMGFKEVRQIKADFNLMAKELGLTEILQTDFVSNVSHEFKTPISAIEGYVTLLQDKEHPLTPQQTECVAEILDNTERLSSLVGNMLLLSKVDNQGIQTPKNTYRLDEQIRQALLSHERRWTENETEFDVDMEPLEYHGNEKLLFHVWSNLIDNAIKFGPKKGLIRMKLLRRDGKTIFTIEDEGPGIKKEDQSHIFDRFYQADGSHKEEGNGLGLAIVKQIVHLEGGSITVENIPDGGCKFTVAL